ncbi:hypothetical protein SGLAM104S_06245 [Streptomyces glaucescens]
MWGTDINMRLGARPERRDRRQGAQRRIHPGAVPGQRRPRHLRRLLAHLVGQDPALGMVPALYMSEIFLVGGGNDERDSGLPVC